MYICVKDSFNYSFNSWKKQLLNVWYVNSILGTFRLEEENDAICGLTLCTRTASPELEPLPRRCTGYRTFTGNRGQLNEYFGARRIRSAAHLKGFC